MLRSFDRSGPSVAACAFMASHAVHACAVGASIEERTGTAGTVERGALLGPRVAASDGGRNLHGMTGADAVPTWISAPMVPTFAVPRARTFAGDAGGPVELHGMTGCRCPSGVRSSRRDANGWPMARGHGRRCTCRRVRSSRLVACAGRGRVHRADGHAGTSGALRAPGAARGRFRWRARSSRRDRCGRGADVRRAQGADVRL